MHAWALFFPEMISINSIVGFFGGGGIFFIVGGGSFVFFLFFCFLFYRTVGNNDSTYTCRITCLHMYLIINTKKEKKMVKTVRYMYLVLVF